MNNSSRKLLLFLTLTLTLTLLHSDDFFAVREKIIDESRFKLAFVYFTPLLLLDNVGYTSSIYTYTDKQIPDWTGDIGVGLRASVLAANRLIFQADELPYYSFYLDNKNLRAWSNRFASSAFSYLGPFSFKAGFKRSDLNQRPNLEFSRPYKYVDSEWSGAVDFGRHDNLFLTAYASFSKLAYDENSYLGSYNLAESLNHRDEVFGLKLNKRVFSSTIIYLNYEISEYIFDSNSERDTRAQTMGLGVDFPRIGVLQGGFQIGFRRFDPKNPFFQRSQSLNGRGDVRIMLFERMRFNMFYALGTNFSYSANDLFYNNRSLGAGTEIYLTRFLKAGTTYEDSRLKYHSFLESAVIRSDRIRQQQYFLAVPFLGKTSIGLAYNVYRLTSDALHLDYTRTFWGGFLSYEF
jgi:hypothetical protein